MSDRSDGSVLWFLAGAALGAAAGVLLAPRSGRETRERLGDWLKESREKGEEFLGKVKEEAAAKKEAVAAAAKAARQAYTEAESRHHESRV